MFSDFEAWEEAFVHTLADLKQKPTEMHLTQKYLTVVSTHHYSLTPIVHERMVVICGVFLCGGEDWNDSPNFAVHRSVY